MVVNVVGDDPPSSFDDFYRRERSQVVGLLYGLTGNRWWAEELAQEAFLAAHRRWDRIGAYDDPGAWVRRVAVNHSVSSARRRMAEARALARLGRRRVEPVELLAPADEEFWAAVRALPTRQAQAVTLHYLEDRSVDDIAAVLGCAPATVKVHLHRGRNTLATKLDCTLEED